MLARWAGGFVHIGPVVRPQAKASYLTTGQHEQGGRQPSIHMAKLSKGMLQRSHPISTCSSTSFILSPQQIKHIVFFDNSGAG